MTATNTPENYPLGWIDNGKGIKVEKSELSRDKLFKYTVKFDIQICFDIKHHLSYDTVVFMGGIAPNIWDLKTKADIHSLIAKRLGFKYHYHLSVEGFNYLKDIFNNNLKEVRPHDYATAFFIDSHTPNIWDLKIEADANFLIAKIFAMDEEIHFCIDYDQRFWYDHEELIELSILMAKDRKFSYSKINSNMRKDYLEAAADLYNSLNRDGYTPCDKVIELADFFLTHPKTKDANRVARRKKIKELTLNM